jgi:DNA-binding MarR family transcriptional regulator
MKLMHNGLHKNVGFIIQHCGGYNQEYHIIKLAERLNIHKADITKLFKESARKNLYHYIELLENNMDIEKVLEMMEEDNRLIRKNLNTTMAIMGGIIANSPYKNML